jgi:iron complex outermembrane receptor protein
MQTRSGFGQLALSAIALTGLTLGTAAQAQDLGDVLLEEIIVTATKRAGGIEAQQAAVAVTAYGSNQLDAMHIRDLQAIGYSAPSVQLEDIGTTRGTANFSIRGLGINSSIPTIDPTVGVFVDGMYYGIPGGVVMDIFDLESVEVLRGPQGLLFGRNVTGGAVLMNTTRPTEDFTLNARAAYETGDNRYLSAVARGPLTDAIGWKLAVYNNDDGGWHTNLADGNDEFGQAKTTMVRGALEFDITDSFNLLLRAEYGQSEGDGPAGQNAGCAAAAFPGVCVRKYSKDEFDFGIDETGFYDSEWTNLIAEVNWDVAFGDGTITNILGYRQYENLTLGDIDSTPLFIFHARSSTDQDQISNELRYSGSWDNVFLTTGIYYFDQNLEYFENRLLPVSGFPPPGITGGGNQDHTAWAVFAQFDLRLSEMITLNIGGRYTDEEKSANIATIPLSALNQCVYPNGCSTYDFNDSRSWDNFTPKLGIQIAPNEDTQFYAFTTKGFRSGGYNMRHTAVGIPNEAFDEEELRSVEIGMKKDFAGGKVRANLAAYRNRVENMQREINLSDPVVGVVQLIKNTADATIKGVDAELTAVMTDRLVVKASLGYVSGTYDDIIYDISGDGVVDSADAELEIPRLAPWSYGGEIIYSRDTSWGSFTAQASGYHRDKAYYTDNNFGELRAADMFGGRLGFNFLDDSLIFSIFGKNLKDEVTIGGDTQLGSIFPGATFSPLNKGKIYGVEIQYIMD